MRHLEERKRLPQQMIQESTSQLLSALGLNLTDPHLVGTSERVARAYTDDLCRGLFESEPAMKTFPSEGYDEMILVKDIEVCSLCSHHMLPYIGKAYVAYIPDDKVLGLSKINRWVDWLSRRPSIQEKLTKDIATGLVKSLHPKGVAVVVKAYHLCMMIRGVKQKGFAVTSFLLGAFKENVSTRQEFFNLVESNDGGSLWK